MTASEPQILPQERLFPTQRMASPDDFGAGTGQALQGLASGVAQLGAKLQANAKQSAAFGAEDGFIKTQTAVMTDYEQNLRNINGSADGWWTASKTKAGTALDTYIKDLPADQQPQFRARADQFLQGFTAKAFKDQFTQQDANSKTVIDQSNNTAALQVQQNPDVFKQIKEQQTALIMKSTLPSQVKQGLIDNTVNTLAYTSELSRAQNDPTKYIAHGSKAQSALGFFESKGWTSEQAAGIVGNLMHESGLNTGAYNANDPGGSVGVGQWNRERRAELEKFAAQQGKPASDFGTQLAFVQHELETSESGSGEALKSAKNVGEATAIMIGYERPKGWTPDNPQGGLGWKSRLNYAGQVLNGKVTGGEGGNGNSDAFQHLTPQQAAAVDETAQRTLSKQAQDTTQAGQAQHAAKLNDLYSTLNDGNAPANALAQARGSWLTDYDEINKAQGIIDKRNKGQADLQRGNAAMAPPSPGETKVFNPYDVDTKNGLDAWATNAVKNGADPAAVAQQVFNKTGLVTSDFGVGIRGAMAANKPDVLGAGLTTAANMMRVNPNAFAGVTGQSDIEAMVQKFNTAHDLHPDTPAADIAQKIITDTQEISRNPVKKEMIDQFKKDNLTQTAVEARVKGLFSSMVPFSGLPNAAQLPPGAQRGAMNSIYSGLAQEGYGKFNNPTDALNYADTQFKKQFGLQNGVVTRFPPSQANLPQFKLAGQSDPYAWQNEQARDYIVAHAAEHGSHPDWAQLDPSQIVFAPVTSPHANTDVAFNGAPDTVKRDVGVTPSGAKMPMVQSGNIDLTRRPTVKNADGTVSTVRSMSFEEDGAEVLVPTVARDGSRILSDQEAIDQFHKTGEFLGKFKNADDATAYAEVLHKDQEAGVLPKSFKSVPYALTVIPKLPGQEPVPLNGVFYPDIETYVRDKNAKNAALVPVRGWRSSVATPAPMMTEVDAQAAKQAKLDVQTGKDQIEAKRRNADNMERELLLPENDPFIQDIKMRAAAGDDDPRIARILEARAASRGK
jgi:hypothetical protein